MAGTVFGSDEWPIEYDSTNRTLKLGPPQPFSSHSGEGWAALDREGRCLALPCQDHVRVFDVATRRERARLAPCPKVSSVAVSPDGEWVAAGNWRGSGVRLFRVASGKLDRELPASESACVGFSPDSRWLVIGHGREFQLYRTSSWQLVHSIQRDSGSSGPNRSCFSRDGRILALAHSNFLIRLVDPETAQELATLEPASPQFLAGLAFSPDGSQLAAACSTHVIQLWDLRAIREQLKAINLDWDAPPLPPAHPPTETGELTVTVLGQTETK